MANIALEEIKKNVKKEFNKRKKTEQGLKLGHVFEDVSRRAGFKSWNEYSEHLKALR